MMRYAAASESVPSVADKVKPDMPSGEFALSLYIYFDLIEILAE
jgi:hypothetical protein